MLLSSEFFNHCFPGWNVGCYEQGENRALPKRCTASFKWSDQKASNEPTSVALGLQSDTTY